MFSRLLKIFGLFTLVKSDISQDGVKSNIIMDSNVSNADPHGEEISLGKVDLRFEEEPGSKSLSTNYKTNKAVSKKNLRNSARTPVVIPDVNLFNKISEQERNSYFKEVVEDLAGAQTVNYFRNADIRSKSFHDSPVTTSEKKFYLKDCFSDIKDEEEGLLEALNYLNKYEKNERFFQKDLKENRAIIKCQIGDYRGAIDDLKDTKNDPLNMDVLAMAYLSLGKLDKALKYANLLLGQESWHYNDKKIGLHHVRGVIYAKMGMYEEAILDFEEEIERAKGARHEDDERKIDHSANTSKKWRAVLLKFLDREDQIEEDFSKLRNPDIKALTKATFNRGEIEQKLFDEWFTKILIVAPATGIYAGISAGIYVLIAGGIAASVLACAYKISNDCLKHLKPEPSPFSNLVESFNNDLMSKNLSYRYPSLAREHYSNARIDVRGMIGLHLRNLDIKEGGSNPVLKLAENSSEIINVFAALWAIETLPAEGNTYDFNAAQEQLFNQEMARLNISDDEKNEIKTIINDTFTDINKYIWGALNADLRQIPMYERGVERGRDKLFHLGHFNTLKTLAIGNAREIIKEIIEEAEAIKEKEEGEKKQDDNTLAPGASQQTSEESQLAAFAATSVNRLDGRNAEKNKDL